MQQENEFVYPSESVATNSEFLSDSYFFELSEQYDQIRDKHRKWYIFDSSKAIASHAILTRMMNDLMENEELLDEHKNFDLFFETFDRHVRRLSHLTEEIHYFRNELNRYAGAPETLDEMIQLAACGEWRIFSARYHRYEVDEYDAAENVKFISTNGRFEVVYHVETGQLIYDPVNMGTYNYAPGSFNLWKYYLHHKYDKVPWKKWGNTSEVSYKEITDRQLRHGSKEQKTSSDEVKQLIKDKMQDSKACQH